MGCYGSKNVSSDDNSTKFTATTPKRARRPRDMLFLFLFIGMLVGMGILANTSWGLGDVGRYLHGEDSWGNVCGRGKNREIDGVNQSGRNMSNNIYEFRMAFSDVRNALDPTNLLNGGGLAATICVSECPNALIECEQLLIYNGYDLNSDVIKNEVCTMTYGVILPHIAVVNRCIPSRLVQMGAAMADMAVQIAAPEIANQDIANMAVKDNQGQGIGSLPISPGGIVDLLRNVVDSVVLYWRDIVCLIAFSCVIVLAVIILLRIFTRVLVVMIITVSGFGSIAVTSFLWYNYLVVQGHVNATAVSDATDSAIPVVDGVIHTISGAISGGNATVVPNVNVNMTDFLKPLSMNALRESSYLLPIAITSLIVTLIILVLLIWLRKSLCLVINLFDEASVAVFSMPMMLFQPLITLIALAVILSYFTYVGVLIATMKNATVVDGMVVYKDYDHLPFLYLIAAHIFGCIWMIEFVLACQQVILASAISGWFFEKCENKNKCNMKLCPTLKPTKDLILYNLGSVALGSMIVTIIQFIRVIVTYMQSKLSGRENQYIKYLLMCMQCCLTCVEKVVRYINRNAYICIAMYGDGFCVGAKNAFTLLLHNAQHMLALNCVSVFCLFLAKVASVALTGLVGVAWFTYYVGVGVGIRDYIIPVVVACTASFVVASCFLGVYEMAIDTIFLCFCDDQQRNNGADRPYFSSVKLQKYMVAKSGERNAPSSSSGPTYRATMHRYRYKTRVSPAKDIFSNPTTYKSVPVEFLLHPNIPSTLIDQHSHHTGNMRRKNLTRNVHIV